MQLGSLLITIVNKDHCTLIAVHSVQCFVSGLSRRSCGRCSAYGKGGTQLLIAYTEPLFTHWIVFVLWLPLVKSSNRRLRIHHCYACVIFIYIYIHAWLALFEYSAWQTWCTGDARNLFSIENLFESWLGYQWTSLKLLIACKQMLGWYRKTAATTPMSIAVIFPSVLFSVYQREVKCLTLRPAKCGIREDFPGMFIIQFYTKFSTCSSNV